MLFPKKDLVDLLLGKPRYLLGSLDVAATVSFTTNRRRSLLVDLPLGGATAHVIYALICLSFAGAMAIHHYLGF
jgi:hypothetical protein